MGKAMGKDRETEGRSLKLSLLLRQNMSPKKHKKDFDVLSEEMLRSIDDTTGSPLTKWEGDGPVSSEVNEFSLFQGFSATLPPPANLIEYNTSDSDTYGGMKQMQDEINYRLDLIEIRKGLSSTEIEEIDYKVDQLQLQRQSIFDRIAQYENEKSCLENRLLELQARLKDADTSELSDRSLVESLNELQIAGEPASSPKRVTSVKHSETLQRYYKPGDQIREIKHAHDTAITCLAFDEPFGTMVTASRDNTVRVWDLSRYKCTGALSGHKATVTCMDMQGDLVVTGSMDATLKLWNAQDQTLQETFASHMDEVTAVSMNGDNLVSASADKTLRQWDTSTGRCMQTIDVMWATSMSKTTVPQQVSHWEGHPFISSLQVFDAALATAGSDGIVRLWDLRSGKVVRQLVGHTGPVNCLEFDDRSIVTGSADKSVRIWDLRMGNILDSYAYEREIISLQFDYSRVVCTDMENTIRVYDRASGKHWRCGAGKDSATVNCARYCNSYVVEGRDDGTIGIWAL